jgi:predicted RNA-binding protein associated with RNAse of E/G family
MLPTGEVLLLDEDELEEALDDGIISQKDSDMAQRTAARLLELIRNKKFPYFDMSIHHRKMLLDKLGWEKGTSFG